MWNWINASVFTGKMPVPHRLEAFSNGLLGQVERLRRFLCNYDRVVIMTHSSTLGSVCLRAAPLFVLLSSTVAMAAGDAHEASKPNLFTGDLGNIIWSLVTFFGVLLVLGKFAWGPILGTLQKREDFIRDSLTNAKKDRDEAQATLQKHTEQLNAARDEASAIVDEGRRDADVLRRKIEDEARAESKAMVERARQEISLATDAAVKELYDVSGKLATEIASRIINEEIDAAKHEKLINASLEELAQTVGSK